MKVTRFRPRLHIGTLLAAKVRFSTKWLRPKVLLLVLISASCSDPTGTDESADYTWLQGRWLVEVATDRVEQGKWGQEDGYYRRLICLKADVSPSGHLQVEARLATHLDFVQAERPIIIPGWSGSPSRTTTDRGASVVLDVDNYRIQLRRSGSVPSLRRSDVERPDGGTIYEAFLREVPEGQAAVHFTFQGDDWLQTGARVETSSHIYWNGMVRTPDARLFMVPLGERITATMAYPYYSGNPNAYNRIDLFVNCVHWGYGANLRAGAVYSRTVSE